MDTPGKGSLPDSEEEEFLKRRVFLLIYSRSMCITQCKHEMGEILSFERRGNFPVGLFIFIHFNIIQTFLQRGSMKGKGKCKI